MKKTRNGIEQVVKEKEKGNFLELFFRRYFLQNFWLRENPCYPNVEASQDAQIGLSFPLDLKHKLAKRSGKSQLVPISYQQENQKRQGRKTDSRLRAKSSGKGPVVNPRLQGVISAQWPSRQE